MLDSGSVGVKAKRAKMRIPTALLLAAFLAVVQLPISALPAPLALLPDEAALREIFIGRCDEFQLVRHPELFDKLKNCSQLWEAFRAAALSSDECRPAPSTFRNLTQLADHSMPAGKSVFWSGVYDLIEKVQELPEYYPIDKTLIGYMLNSLDWCNRNCNASSGDGWQLEEPLPSDQQPEWLQAAPRHPSSLIMGKEANCNNFTLPFWIAASQWFAAKALGRAFVILNASVPTPFRENSIFGQYELPLISAARVNVMDIYLVNSLEDMKSSGSCNHDSVTRLELRLQSKGIRTSCTENPDFLVHILCADKSDVERCRLIGLSSARPRPSSRLTLSAVAGALAFIVSGLRLTR